MVATVAGKRIVLLAVAALPSVVSKAPDDGNIDIVPAVPESPRTGVTDQEEVDAAVVYGIIPAEAAPVKLTPFTADTAGVAVLTAVSWPAAL